MDSCKTGRIKISAGNYKRVKLPEISGKFND